ncbi:MAG: cell division protein SepF [Clostridia bacterium]|nr:cell division protein SepF [Clostridia bacterium]
MKLFDKIKGAFDPKDEYAEDEFDGYGNDDGFGDDEYEPEYTQNTNNAAPAPKANRGMGLNSGALEMKVVKPDKYDSQTAQKIADHLLSNRTVVLNLESTNKESARRLIDFLSGVAYSIGGYIQRVAVNTFIIVPENVDISGEQLQEARKTDDNDIY